MCLAREGVPPAFAEVDTKEFASEARFLRLYLPDRDATDAPDWSLTYAMGDEGARLFEIDVKGSEIQRPRRSA